MAKFIKRPNRRIRRLALRVMKLTQGTMSLEGAGLDAGAFNRLLREMEIKIATDVLKGK